MNRNKLPFLTTPKIVSAGVNENKAYILMEYCKSMDFIEFLSVANVANLESFCGRLICFVEDNIKNSMNLPLDKEAVERKVVSICKAVEEQPLISTPSKSELVKFLMQYCDTMPNWELPVGVCHGDLTFSNILFRKSGGQIVLIDFLDTFIETPLQDLVIIRQDTRYLWSLMLIPDRSYDKVKTKTALRFIDRMIDRHFSQYDFYNIGYRYFQILNFARIVPYVKSQQLMNEVIKTITTL